MSRLIAFGMDKKAIANRLARAIEDRRERNGETSYDKLASEVGRTPEMVRQWATKKSLPPLPLISKVCSALGIAPAYLLLDMKDDEPGTKRIPVSPDELVLLETYRQCNTKGREEILANAEFFRQRYPIPDNVKSIR